MDSWEEEESYRYSNQSRPSKTRLHSRLERVCTAQFGVYDYQIYRPVDLQASIPVSLPAPVI